MGQFNFRESLSCLLGVLGCSENNTDNLPPVAVAGSAQIVNAGTAVILDGSQSSDPESQPLMFAWTQTAGPHVTLNTPTSATPNFTAPQVAQNTVLTFQLVVNDGTLNSAPSTVNVTVRHVNLPMAHAGIDLNATTATTVTLDGSQSTDPTGQPLTFNWTQTVGPLVTLSNAQSPKPSFPIPVVTADIVLTFQLVVSNGTNTSAPATVTVTIRAHGCLRDGDVNQDGQVTPGDALLAFRAFLNLASLDTCQQMRANVENAATSGVTPADALCIFRKFLRLPSCLGETAP